MNKKTGNLRNMDIRLIMLAVLPSVVLALFIILYDRYDREPFRLLIKVFFSECWPLFRR